VRSLAAAVLVGYLAARLGWLATRAVFGSPVLARSNYRGRSVATGVGVVITVAVLLVEGGRVTAAAFGVGDVAGLTTARAVVLLAALGFGVLGFLDDVAGTGGDRGFRGHLGAAAAGRLTTGMVKLLGGAVVALVAVAPVVGRSPGRLLADAVLVALSANLGNLLDRAPGRTIKAGVAAFVVLALAADRTANLGGVAVAVGAGLGLLLDDLHERLMLGDAGSNVLGAVLGLGLVLACGPVVRDLALVSVAFLNVLGEVVSFSRVIDAVAPLRALDRAGRRP
jgi:UDP-GlcNAc:undecaprenyl-phosphate GlcNAc-1-phosphate transferase